MTHAPPHLHLLPEAVRQPFAALPRLPLGTWPTPLEDCPRLARALGLRQLLVKRDDLSGPALGGHKVRQVEYTLGAVLEQGYQGIIIGVGEGSNHARVLAPLCRRLGLRLVVVITQAEPPPVLRGNLLLTTLAGAEMRYFDANDFDDALVEHCHTLVAEYAAGGVRLFPLVFPEAGIIGAAAGLAALLELRAQAAEANVQPDALMIASGNGFLAGLALGAQLLGWPLDCRGAPAGGRHDPAARTARFGNLLAERLGLQPSLSAANIHLTTAPPAVWQSEAAALEAMRVAGETEGLFLDPVHTGPALAALRADLQSGALPPDRSVVFWHTGGIPAIFAADDRLTEYLRRA